MIGRRKDKGRSAPTLAEVEAEAAQYRKEANDLRTDMLSLRSEIATTSTELQVFAQMMKATAPS